MYVTFEYNGSLLRMNTETGETWVLNLLANRWDPISTFVPMK